MRPGFLAPTITAILATASLLAGCASPGSTTGPLRTDVMDGGTDLQVNELPGSDVDAQDTRVEEVGFDLPVSDVIVRPPDISISKQPLGGVCGAGEDCDDGWCNTYYTGGYCSLLCTASSECPDGGKCYDDPNGAGKMCWKACSFPNDCRPDQFCAPGAKICTPKCVPNSCTSGYECNQGSGECNPIGTITCVPNLETCDGVDNDCDNIVDEGCGPGISPQDGFILTDLGQVVAGDNGLSQVLEFDVSSGAKGFQIITVKNDGSDAFLGVYQLTAPSGDILISGFNPYEHVNRAYPGFGTATVQVPITPDFDFETGKYSMSLYRSGPLGEVWVYVIQTVRPEPVQSVIDLNFWFVGLPLNAAGASGNTKFQSLVSNFAGLLVEHGITIRNLNYYDVTGTDAQKFTIIDSGSGEGVDEHGELLRLSAGLPASNKGLNFFFVQGFTGWGLLGRAGGIPGPAMQGTSDSGVVVSLSEFYDYPANLAVPFTARTMLHEMGHQLGLSHTTEQQASADIGWIHDPIADTPACENDSNGDGIVDTGECIGSGHNNVMFWEAHAGSFNTLTPGQKYVIHRSPYLAEP